MEFTWIHVFIFLILLVLTGILSFNYALTYGTQDKRFGFGVAASAEIGAPEN